MIASSRRSEIAGWRMYAARMISESMLLLFQIRSWLMVTLVASPAVAAESQVDDLRGEAESRPMDFTSRWDDRLGSRSGEGSFDQAWAVGLGWRRGWGPAGRPWRALMGIEVIALHEAGRGISSNGEALRLEAGAGLAVSHRLSLTMLPMLGYGRVALSADPGAAADLTLAGPLTELGVRAGARWSFTDRWSVACELGWLRTDERLRGDDAMLRLTTSGPWAGVSLAWTIDPSPKTLE